MSNEEINLTLFHPSTSKTDALSISSLATLADLSSFAGVLLNLDGGGVVLALGDKIFYNPSGNDSTGVDGIKTLAACGVADGALITVYTTAEFERQMQRTNGAATAASANSSGSLDFSALLGAGTGQRTNGAATAASASSNGNLDFSTLLGAGAGQRGGGLNFSAITKSSATSTATQQPVQWDGMK